jgi:hypothetical protein
MAAWLESAWLARYLDRALSDDEAAWFEAYLLDKPDLLALVETDLGLRDAAATLTNPQALVVEGGPTPRPKKTDRTHARRLNFAAAAATLVVGVALGLYLRGGSAPSGYETAVIANPTRAVFGVSRGAQDVPRIEHGDGTYLLLEFPMTSDASDVVLDLGNGKVLPLTPSTDGFASVVVPRAGVRQLERAQLRYKLRGVDQSTSIQIADFFDQK